MLLVGTGKSCINPANDMFPIPSRFADFGVPLLQNGIYDDAFCRAIAVDKGTETFMLMSFETRGYPGVPKLAQILSDKTGIPAENFIISGTHNHSIPVDTHSPGKDDAPEEIAFHREYWKIETAAALEACIQAVGTMKPARFGYGETQSYVNVNRDYQTMFGYWVEARNLEGYSDKTLAIMKFVDMDGKLIAALLNYGMHNTCIHMMKDFDGVSKTSGNVSGIACRFVEEHFGNDAIVLWTSGAAGNQNPLFSHNLQYEYPDGYTTSVPLPDGVGYMMMELMGRTHGVDAVKGLNKINTYTEELPFKHVSKNCYIPSQKHELPPKEGTPIRMVRQGGIGLREPNDTKPVKLPELPKMVDDLNHPAELQMNLTLIGDIAIVGIGAEPYAEIGRDIKAVSPYKHTFVMTHCTEKRCGYILDKTSKEHSVFQSFGRVKPGSADDIIIQNAIDLFKEVSQ